MSASINCPSQQPTPGSIIIVTGQSSDPANTKSNVNFNGATIPGNFSMDSSGACKWEITVPPCVAGQPNIVEITLKVGSRIATCPIQVSCP